MKMVLIASIVLFVISLAFFSYVVRHPRHIDVSATPPVSEEIKERERQAIKACTDAFGVVYYENGKYAACMIKKDLGIN